MLRRFICASKIVTIGLAAMLCAGAIAQQGAVTAQVLGRIDSRRSVEGASFFVKTASPWMQGRCSIPGGTTLEGRIAKVQRKSAKTKREEMDLRFLPVPCSGDESQDIIPILVAMQNPHHDPAEDFVMQQEMVSIFSHVRKSPATSSNTPGGGAPSSPIGGNAAGTAGSLGNYSPTSSTEHPYRAAEALGFPGVKLRLPVLTTDPTGISSSTQLLIDPGTRFRLVLQPAPRPVAPATPDPARAAIGIPPAEKPKPLPGPASGQGSLRNRKLC